MTSSARAASLFIALSCFLPARATGSRFYSSKREAREIEVLQCVSPEIYLEIQLAIDPEGVPGLSNDERSELLADQLRDEGSGLVGRVVGSEIATDAKEKTMPLYLSKFSYTPETWAKLIGNPEDRRRAAQSYIESVGGKLHGFWYAFGTHDGYNLWEAPDNVSMAAVALAISAGGALSSIETTVLLTVDETIDALRKAAQVRYRAPGT